ncbi:alpha-ribazole phosphatase [Anaerovibrio lipolyticus DSM 3074]|uniref:Alpha-ribazole phosphatase n=1 Tax=Anaerovibrio lipolyticus DSM 3074 TaxID=1120997 RepID=A0A1M6GB05_9FIRM|nr:alpha-ribazole phosphatase [Anaerovibrio lipolyticus]SHJ07148.1 alpha-ribazole phosphatase [Anaerovibrio lipolyticus DSM 3074]
MTKLILVRHGQTVWNKLGKYQGQADIELSEEGRKQAAMLADNFPIEKVDAIYSSPLIRAKETAEAIGAAFSLPVETCPEFCEISFGKWEGLTYDEIHAQWPKEHDLLFNRPDLLTCPEGEGFSQVQKRAAGKMEALIKENPDKTLVIAAHGGVIRTLLCHALGMPLKNMWRIRQDNTAVNLVTAYNEGLTVELMNSTVHLSDSNLNMNLNTWVKKS